MLGPYLTGTPVEFQHELRRSSVKGKEPSVRATTQGNLLLRTKYPQSSGRRTETPYPNNSMANETGYAKLGMICATACLILERGVRGKERDDLSMPVHKAIGDFMR